MLPDFAPRLRAFAEVIVRGGLNLQPGQRLLIAEPYELQGVARSAEVIVDAVRTAALEAGCPGPAAIEVIWGDGARLREFAEKKDWRGFARLVGTNAAAMQDYVRNGDALLFLQGSQPHLLDGIPTTQVAELRRISWEYFGPVAQQLMTGATNWTVAPAPSPAWANVVYADLRSEQRLAALWSEVFEACHVAPVLSAVPDGNPTAQARAVWQAHLQALQKRRDDLNARQLTTLRYVGEGTDLTVALPPGHSWCTAQLTTGSGVSFVANLPTEEVFTLPHRDSSEGRVRVSRPIIYGGAAIEGIDLEFRRGRVVKATAKSNAPLLQQLLATDEGSARLGEVALVLNETSLTRSGRLYHHALLDENASNHVALGEAYGFCLRAPDPAAMNRSLIHVDLPLDGRVVLS
jgi:aminopeptidase